MSRKIIGLMGGTFDPVHHGHLVAAEEARSQFNMDQVIFIPAGKPPHKTNKELSTPEDRLAMTKAAVSSNPYFTVSDIEIKKSGLSYTINTVRAMKEIYPGQEIYFITGADAVLEILTWKNYTNLLEECIFVAASRPGFDLGKMTSDMNAFPPKLLERIKTIQVPALAISSTDIRQRVCEERPIKYLLPETVEEYILCRRLYSRCLVKSEE